jgi:hypothetical protein
VIDWFSALERVTLIGLSAGHLCSAVVSEPREDSGQMRSLVGLVSG